MNDSFSAKCSKHLEQAYLDARSSRITRRMEKSVHLDLVGLLSSRGRQFGINSRNRLIAMNAKQTLDTGILLSKLGVLSSSHSPTMMRMAPRDFYRPFSTSDANRWFGAFRSNCRLTVSASAQPFLYQCPVSAPGILAVSSSSAFLLHDMASNNVVQRQEISKRHTKDSRVKWTHAVYAR